MWEKREHTKEKNKEQKKDREHTKEKNKEKKR
jgi:hypothetical protein